MASANLVHRPQVRKTRRADLTPVWPLAPITHDKDTHLTLRRLDRTICLPRRHRIPLRIQQEMVNQRLHVLLHGSSWRWHDLVILDLDSTRRHFV
jgi:hypothetical protein